MGDPVTEADLFLARIESIETGESPQVVPPYS